MATIGAELETRIRKHMARNAELVRLIEAKGVDIDELRLIECHFWAPDDLSANALATHLEQRGFKKVRENASSAGVWNLEMTLYQSVRETAAEQFTTNTALAAANHNATYDGWGTSL